MNNPRPMRVALLCPYSLSAYGGVQLQVLGLARALRARGVDAKDLDEAIEIAAKIPAARYGSIEVRPVWEI